MKYELFLFSVLGALLSTALTHPSKPLNERSTELAWEAWLLVDQSNQSQKNPDVGQLRRRITPKSVFIAPTFVPDSLPACAEGYLSDSMGRCVKIIKIDESAHLEFLMQKFNDQYADYEEEPEEMQTQGPFQVNIPLDGGFLEDETADMAIVVAPKQSAQNKIKFDVKRNDNDKLNKENIAAILGVKPEDLETTTFAGISTTTSETTETTTLDTTTLDTTTFETTLRQETTTDAQSTTYAEEQTNRNQEERTDRNQEQADQNTEPAEGEKEEETEGEALFFKWSF